MKNWLTLLKPYKKADVIWCQEESKNMGAWTYLDRRLEEALKEADINAKRPLYIGRPESASPATGLLSRHLFEQNLLVSQALNLVK
jgi:2-oxoglutarate dehydrogenase E1 component